SAPPLPPVRPVAHALVQGLLEVLAGVRPVTQLKRRTSTELYDDLEARVHAQPRVTGARPLTGAVQSLHVQEPAPGVAEVCATVRRGPRAAALALRLEHLDGQWCCTSLAGLTGSAVRA
ncbi:MAG: Rv3235 family protein, partial [Actinomycetota bacterium]|nr:Rv3235 family protein [Actinomycetota bacterium]